MRYREGEREKEWDGGDRKWDIHVYREREGEREEKKK